VIPKKFEWRWEIIIQLELFGNDVMLIKILAERPGPYSAKEGCRLALSLEVKSRIERLDRELEDAAKQQRRDASKSYYSSQAMLFASLVCSLAAAISGIFFGVSPKIVGGIATLPPLIAYLAVSFRLELRQNWYFRKAVALEKLRSRLLYQLPEEPTVENVSAIAAARDTLVSDMQREWYETITKNFLEFTAHKPKPPLDGP
jgi:hypothetical protein